MLGEIVFINNVKRRQLETITGIYILLEILKEIFRNAWIKKIDIMLLDAALLYESKYLKYLCFPVCVVYISDEVV